MPPQKTSPATTQAKSRVAKASPARVFDTLPLSEPWMIAWAVGTLTTGSAEESCAVACVSLADFADARRCDPVFDKLCGMLDQIADLRATGKLHAAAIKGDARAQALYYARVRDLVLPKVAASQPAETMMTATIAEAMIAAGLLAAATAAAAAPGASQPAIPRDWRSKPPATSTSWTR